MVVADLDVVGVAVLEAETDSPLVVDGDRVLADSIALERMEPVTWRDPEELNLSSRVERTVSRDTSQDEAPWRHVTAAVS
jgi:hypothetical protein